MLNADELGEKGQARFKELCADAKLICNKSDRDRTGWDFIVEFPFDLTGGSSASLENRRIPPSFHVQVKTLLEGSNKIQLRLTSAERLAKEQKPSLIYVLKVNAALEFTSAFFIHLLDNPLGRILKRLRKEDVLASSSGAHRDAVRPNKQTISFSVQRAGTPLPPTGKTLRQMLLSIVGKDMESYIHEKHRQLRELGFDERPCELSFVVDIKNIDEAADFFLGLKQSVPASDISIHLTRFGIKKALSGQDMSGATISITPNPIDTCVISVREDTYSVPAVFRGNVFDNDIPHLPGDRRCLVHLTDLVRIDRFNTSFQIATRPSVSGQTPSAWSSFWRFTHAFATGRGVLEIMHEASGWRDILPIPPGMTRAKPELCKQWEHICDKISDLLRLAGILEEPKLSLDDIRMNVRQITFAHALSNPSRTRGKRIAEFCSDYDPALDLNMEAAYVDYLSLGDITLGYYGKSQITGKRSDQSIRWSAENFAFLGIEQLRDPLQDYPELMRTARQAAGCMNLISRTYEPDDGGLPDSNVAERDHELTLHVGGKRKG